MNKQYIIYTSLIAAALIVIMGMSNISLFNATNSEIKDRDAHIESLIREMSIDEKLGQLDLQVGDLYHTGPHVRTTESDRFDDLIREGKITGLFNIHGADYIRRLQHIAVDESRLGIPLLIGADVIHGLKTIFPIPLGEASSWDPELARRTAAAAAKEASAAGINWTFAPVLDLSRDARWGRIAEGAGEDPYLSSLIGAARVKGFQGDDLQNPESVAACIKHFAAYGAPEAGREYNTVDMSEHRFRSIYLPPYKAGIDAGAATIMAAFHELNGVPVTGSEWLFREILREELGFEGFVVTDWQTIKEMEYHGFTSNMEESAEIALKAGCDMDMMSSAYTLHITELIKEGKISERLIDEAVRNILKVKYDLGLFDDPYKYADPVRERQEIRTAEARELAREAARKSIVLLKNENNILPVTGNEKIALIGPFAEDQAEHNGMWSLFAEPQDVVSIKNGFTAMMGNGKLTVSKGCDFMKRDENALKEAISVAKEADLVFMALGETALMNGEAGSRTNIGLPQAQMELLKAVEATGTPIVLLLTHGRPMDLSWMDENIEGILACWTLGSESGNAIADVVSGKYNPSGRLPVSFPRNVGQVPIYYNMKSTGRYYEGDNTEPLNSRVYRSRYIDVHFTPLYSFGYGLSYSNIKYGKLIQDKKSIDAGESITFRVEVINNGPYDAVETVQLYLQDPVASVTRPIKELKGFQQVKIKNGESKQVSFTLTEKDLEFLNADMEYVTEPGSFRVFIGPNTHEGIEAGFTYMTEEIIE
jgi:beta-glucosidase